MPRALFAAVRCPRCGKPFPRARYLAPRMALAVHLNRDHAASAAGLHERMVDSAIEEYERRRSASNRDRVFR